MERTEEKTVRALKAHIALNVKNVERSLEFYKKLFGIEPSKARTGYAKFNVENPPLNFTLNQLPFGERGALSHLGIQVGSTEDVLAVRSKWQESGLISRGRVQTARDPDGNEWEVFVVPEDNLPGQAHGTGSTGEIGEAVNVCEVFEDDEDNSLVIRWC